jgi:hypothetical protein
MTRVTCRCHPYYSLTRVRGEPGECRFDQSAIYTGGASLPHWQR